MGDMADWIIDQGMEEYDAHERGECYDGCPYCSDDSLCRKARAKRQKRATQTEEER